MSFVYMPIPGCSVPEERQLRAGLAPSSACCGGCGPRAWRLSKATLTGPDYSSPAF